MGRYKDALDRYKKGKWARPAVRKIRPSAYKYDGVIVWNTVWVLHLYQVAMDLIIWSRL